MDEHFGPPPSADRRPEAIAMSPREYLAEWLRWNHPAYTIDDVALTGVPGYLASLKACPRVAGPCSTREHYHSFCLQFVRHGYRNPDTGRWESPTRFWKELHGHLPVAEESRYGFEKPKITTPYTPTA